MIKIGTSGYSFPDWTGSIYPKGLKKDEFLSYYEKELGFNTLELNYTYYTLPSQKAVAGLLKKTSENFEFAIKANRGMTHDLINKDTGKKTDNTDIFNKFRYSIDPLIKENRLSCVLAQFPFSFHYNKNNIEYLKMFKSHLIDIPLVFEFRNIGWHTLKVLEFLTDAGIGYCIVDEPKIKGLMPFTPAKTSDIGYFRFHGRNPKWFDAPLEIRYDYLYNEDELINFIEPIKKIEKQTRKTLIFFNNCHAGSAAKNAVQLAKMLDLQLKSILL